MVTGSSDSRILPRRLTLADAVFVGLGSMIGAGVFAVFAPAAAVAGVGLVLGLVIAGVVALCNATSSAQFAVQYPTSGGTYVYGRERLGEWPGFLAGWSFVIGKTASCAAMALTFAAYTVEGPWQKLVAVLAVMALATVNLFGITRTALLTRILVAGVLVVLLVVIVITVRGAISEPVLAAPWTGVLDDGWYGILQSAGLLFFAFAGYARIATMGEEVKSPSRSIPRAILISLSIVLLLYAALAVLLLITLGPDRLAASASPLADAVAAQDAQWAIPVVQVGAALAALGALLALIAGVGRTTLAMARNGDLPRSLDRIHPRSQVPHRAEIVIAIAVCMLVLALDVRQAIGFSSFGVLLYYLVANISAFTQDTAHRRYPKALQVLGTLGCIVLVATLPWPSVLGGAIVLIAGISYRIVTRTARSTAR